MDHNKEQVRVSLPQDVLMVLKGEADKKNRTLSGHISAVLRHYAQMKKPPNPK
jgi:hypothetical protein